jgi:cytoskeletal protein RodZ
MGYVSRLNIMGSFLGIAAGVLGFAALALASQPVAADTPDEPSQAATASSSDDSGISERKRRREERRREREEANSDQSDETAAGEADTSSYVVYVEPEMECKRVTVSGSRVPKEVCTPVYQQDANADSQEREAQEFLRRTRELGSRVPQPTSPYIATSLPTGQ